jgi:translation initiation factor 1
MGRIAYYYLCLFKKDNFFRVKYNGQKRKTNWKERLNVVYSTNPDFKYESSNDEEQPTTLPANKQNLKESIDRKQRAGKSVTLVQGFIGTDDELKELARYPEK